MTKGYYTFLPHRAGVRISGEDCRGFLQGLLTQDMNKLDTQNIIYSGMLTPQGKIAFDFFVSEQDGSVILECESARAEALLQRLSGFKLRRKIELNIVALHVVALWGDPDTLQAFSHLPDPRDTRLGYRKISLQPIDKNEFNSLEERDLNFYDRLRIRCFAPDGSRDIQWGEDTPAELGLDRLNGVSYDKGCYMGQELTSRMHHRGLAKKKLMAVTVGGEDPLPPFTDILVDGNLVGEMRSRNGNTGLALLRQDSLHLMPRAGITIGTSD